MGPQGFHHSERTRSGSRHLARSGILCTADPEGYGGSLWPLQWSSRWGAVRCPPSAERGGVERPRICPCRRHGTM